MLLKTYLKRILADRAKTELFSENEGFDKNQRLTFAGLTPMRFVNYPMTGLSFNLSSEESDYQHYSFFFFKLKGNVFKWNEGKKFRHMGPPK